MNVPLGLIISRLGSIRVQLTCQQDRQRHIRHLRLLAATLDGLALLQSDSSCWLRARHISHCEVLLQRLHDDALRCTQDCASRQAAEGGAGSSTKFIDHVDALEVVMLHAGDARPDEQVCET